MPTFEPTTTEAVTEELDLKVSPDAKRLALVVAVTNSYVRRTHTDPVDSSGESVEWPADKRLGAARLAAGLYRDANAPGITESQFGGAVQEAVKRRVTDIAIEQLLQIGRFAPPVAL
ncbi:hypothetical protein CVCC1112_2626 [Paenarthrobacter nicotinovorans]|uniref:hypothetical protein n=1 Tax=Paenarthrobacter nicotinovorans TaxID=29320 RepID=UPI0007CCAE62|nr:hypothetical protein [Paenarthrobacter nicotinovorans]GAT87967.1 hypothetical protein CVCC1112_2626 [Paenarthrobacter nicotinovorans]